MKKTIEINGGGFLSMLTILFVGLKLTGHVGWSWWWVLAPLWIPLATAAAVVAVALVAYACTRRTSGPISGPMNRRQPNDV